MRYKLNDHEWAAIKPMLPNKPRGVRRRRRDAAYARRTAHYMTGLPEQPARSKWQFAARRLLDGADAEPLTLQIEYALTLDGHRRF